MPQTFPPELLTQAPAQRLTWFTHKVIRHPQLDATFQAIQDAIRYPAGASLIFVVGATGIGKTTVRLRLERQLVEDALPTLTEDQGRIPVASVEAIAPEQGTFNWKDYYLRALQVLNEPLLEHKRLRGDNGASAPPPRAAVAVLRRSFEACLQHRRLTALLIDEAQHFKKVSSGRGLLDQMDTLKSLAQTTGTLHVLFGTYELLDLINLSAQLGRRSRDIHFARYHLDRADEALAFRNVVYTFQQALPLPTPPNLVDQLAFCYEQSAGCVGVLKEWLNRALAFALDRDTTTLTDALLHEAGLTLPKRLQLARDIQAGEAALSTTDRQAEELRHLLGLPMATPNTRRTTASAGDVGRRRATRDPIGLPDQEAPADPVS